MFAVTKSHYVTYSYMELSSRNLEMHVLLCLDNRSECVRYRNMDTGSVKDLHPAYGTVHRQLPLDYGRRGRAYSPGGYRRVLLHC